MSTALDAAPATFSLTSAGTTLTPDLGGLADGDIVSIAAMVDNVAASLIVEVDDSPAAGTKSSGSVTCSATASDYDLGTDTVTIEGIPFTAVAVGQPLGPYEFAVTDGDGDATAASLLSKLEAHPDALRRCTAARVGNVITFTARVGGTAYDASDALGLRIDSSDNTALAVSEASGGSDAWREIARYPPVTFVSGQIDAESLAEIPVSGLPFRRGVRMRASTGDLKAGSSMTLAVGPVRQVPTYAIT